MVRGKFTCPISTCGGAGAEPALPSTTRLAVLAVGATREGTPAA